MKEVLISIKPKWCELIANGTKTIEVRKTKPKLDTPFKCYIYCTKGTDRLLYRSSYDDVIRTTKIKYIHGIESNNTVLNGKVIGEFVCDAIISHCEMANADIAEQQGYIKREKLLKYAGDKEIYGWHISELVIYDKPKELGAFKRVNRECWYNDLGLAKRDCPECKNESCFMSRPPQSWCYVEGAKE